MNKVKSFLLRVYHVKALKYIVVTLVAIAWVGFIDDNSWWRHMRNQQHIGELQDEINAYTDAYHRDQSKIHELDSDPKAITKIARERYFMKADDEDIFVLSDDEEPYNLNTPDETAQ